MALTLKLGPGSSLNTNSLNGKLLWNLWTSLQKSTRVDQIDSFTNELVERKSLKWDLAREAALQDTSSAPKQQFYKRINSVARSLSQDLEGLRKPELGLDVQALSQCQLDNILSGILDEANEYDFNNVLKQCIAHHILPSNELLTRCLEFMVSIQQVKAIESLSAVCEKVNETFFKLNSNLLPYKSLALWRCGNVAESLKTLEQGYQLKGRNRKALRETFRTIANETVGTKSEAVLVSLTKTAEDIHRNFDEIFVIACVWKNTFTSQWFSDQQFSLELFDKHETLRNMVYKKTTPICYNYLNNHDVDAVHRLIQLYLRYDSRESCSSCLKMLFNYQYWRRDLRACSEIMQFCTDIELPLPASESQKLLNLLLDRPLAFSRPSPKTEFSKFQYKF